MDGLREKLLPMQRKIVRTCSEIIKDIHRKKYDSIPDRIQTTQEDLLKMDALLNNAPGTLPKDYIQIVKQEFGEAAILFFIIVKDEFPSIEELKIDVLDYAYALTDVVGELRRFALNCVRNEDILEANRALEYMEEIFNHLFTLDYPSGLIPGLRKKTDAARAILAKTEGDITLSSNLLKLQKELEKKS